MTILKLFPNRNIAKTIKGKGIADAVKAPPLMIRPGADSWGTRQLAKSDWFLGYSMGQIACVAWSSFEIRVVTCQTG
jgi:hypothetical protein